jgi:NAD(P)-dependent dehydrogenase (short-subunit alcohol dehydrogenase family)
MASKQVALIIGASRGIGRQIAIDLAKNNYIGTLSPIHTGLILSNET